jgi:simple sugar transport system ATP-binding protein
MSTPLLQTENLTKRFGEVIANNDVTFDVVAGEIHCLFGENGAGKSTLSACLSGYYRPDGGRILYQGRPMEMRSPADAIRLGIGIVHQHFVLVPRFTVLENIVVGTQTAGLRLRTDAAEREIWKICDTYGIRLDLDAVVENLSVGEQQWVEILKALYLGARLLIMDEPTAVLTPQQSERLFDLIRAMRAKGMSVIIISHKLREVMQSDRVTVLRKGRVVATVRTSETSPQALTNLMIGRELVAHDRVNGATRGAAVLTLSEVNSLGDRGEAALQDVTLSIHAGEIVGLAGVAGNGQRELFEVLMGVRSVAGGDIRLDGRSIAGASPREILDCGVGYIPEDRFREGLIREFDVAENLVLGWQRSAGYGNGVFMQRRRIEALAKDKIAEYQIAVPSASAPAGKLSGGNAQRVILARELTHASRVLLANQPTRGLDVGVTDYVYRQLLEKRSQGYAILLASEELDDLIRLSDRIAILFKGRIMGILPSSEADPARLGLMMAGGDSIGLAHV